MLEEANLSVGQVAKRCGVKVSTLHFYEQVGLIKSLRNQGNQRRYKREVLRRISVIKAAQKMGVSLEEIKKAFANLPDKRTPTKDDWQQLSRSWRQGLNQKIAYLEKLRDSLDGCIGCGCLSMKNCPIYNPEDILASENNGPVLLERNSN
ncbi:redox-sensitive transcriptional activator SoxR [Colwellia sp. M166]|uniref:redox-sensitive transcriptional activator SoxR n=1 Tax=Colwellia sp. M166 TaxID=2583805 RepID=UPI00211DC368|nr:redox-sensitive transcriptional activator SoxR [Colwellia sp. M166]UUO24874.1 redox-sensitive transcriptional activator SoxR [Colwellia sp. M166]|tara:strand:- start:6364 stop:6813 length:450 start_codon:yes stop_codon:yes gene_type:complete